ncbi:MAG TPA: AAA family ATPase [Candidatus Limnocylindria bacterium]|nr:AAA family ATPase [Candidatus Limnocylindria bacterium]
MYQEFFGLTDAPFRLTPDPRFLYLSPKHAEALAHLRLGLTEPGGFVCITGDIGTGKTTVLRTFLEDLGPEVQTAFIFNPTLSWDDLLQRIARELGVPSAAVTSAVDMMDALNAHLLATRKEGKISVVVIDEAQAVPLEVLERLRLLSNLETSTEKLLRLVLVGQPQLARVLLDPSLAQLNQRITLRWHLRPLTRAETFAYVRHRMTVAGGERAARVFTVPALRLLHRFSGGVPRLVNMIGHRALLAAYVVRQRRVTARIVRRAHREIRNVPLAAPERPRSLRWAAPVAAVGLGLVMLDVPRFPSLRPGVSRDLVQPPAAVEAAVAPGAPSSAPQAVAAIPSASVAAFEQRIDRLSSEESLRDALDAVFAAWQAPTTKPGEATPGVSLATLANRRGLEDLHLTSNLSMLRLLDLPTVLELRSAETSRPVYGALLGIDDESVTLRIGGETLRVPPAVLDPVWFGDAHVFWRDFEWLGPTFGRESTGTHVTRLQQLLIRAGVFDGPATGTFGDATAAAVIAFQRSRRLDPDARVGRLTRIALYNAAGSYRMPSLSQRGDS